MQAGQLDQRVSLYSPTVAKNASDEPETSWSLVATVWARVIGQKGDESFTAARTEAGRVIKVLLRFRADVAVTWRLDWSAVPGLDPEPYDIVDIDRSKARDGELWLMCRARKVA